jgi:hypothetical protein
MMNGSPAPRLVWLDAREDEVTAASTMVARGTAP